MKNAILNFLKRFIPVRKEQSELHDHVLDLLACAANALEMDNYGNVKIYLQRAIDLINKEGKNEKN